MAALSVTAKAFIFFIFCGLTLSILLFRLDTAAPIANPQTGEYVGQTLIDFYPEGVKDGLDRLEALTSFVITPSAGAGGGDTVVGPNKTAEWEAAPIMDLLFRFDGPNSTHRRRFERDCLYPMKNGTSGLKDFQRSRMDGTTEHLLISFVPVYERILLPVNPGGFPDDVEESQVLLYSVGIVRTVSDIHAPFMQIEDAIEHELLKIQSSYITITVIVAVLFASFACVVRNSCVVCNRSTNYITCLFFSLFLILCQVTIYITTPLLTLLQTVRCINKREIDDKLPPLQGGSREVQGVYNTFAKLFKVVRISNTAFFSGNLKWAYHFLEDALKLFRKVKDEKAVGIACNNLSNTLYAAYYEGVDVGLKEQGESCIISIALRHYAEAIELAQRNFEAASEGEIKADFAVQLADRFFNRGLFLLLIQGNEMAPATARELAFTDIEHAKNLDYDAKDFLLDNKLLLKNSEAYFNWVLRRINGLTEFHNDDGLQQVWDVQELIDDADQLLLAAWYVPFAPLFKNVSRAGRLQQLEAASIVLWLKMGNQFEAARLAMRLFSEDEYILESSYVHSADAMVKVLRLHKDDLQHSVSFSSITVASALDDLRRMTKCCKNGFIGIGKCLVFAIELCERWEGDEMLEKINANALSLYDRYCAPNDYMGVAAFSTEESLAVEISIKAGNEGRQRASLDMATSTTTERANPAFPLSIQMVVDSQATLEYDSFILLMVDGYAWDDMSCLSLRLKIARLNQERKTMVHLLILGLDIEDDNAREQCMLLSDVTKLSMYVDATLENIDSVFERITVLIGGRPVNSGFLKGLTMERF